MDKKLLPFWILTFSILCVLTLPVLIQDGMFCDAVLYTSVSRNMSEGIGSFWFPQYSTLNVGGLSSFHEHPPLVFGIQALFFRLLGDSIYVERLYVLVTFALTIFLIWKIWNLEFKENKDVRPYSWVALILWISSPLIFWSYANNIQENTLNIFCLASVFFSLKAIKGSRYPVVHYLLSGLFIFLATMSKGMPGFFPLALPFISWIIYRKESVLKMILHTLFIFSVPVFIYLVLLQFPDSRESLSTYFFKRLLYRVNSMPTTTFRFHSLVRIITELIPAFIIMLIVGTVAYVKKTKRATSILWKQVQFYLLIAAAGSIPLTFTMVQKGLYLGPCFPYLAIALSLLIVPVIDTWVKQINTGSQSFRKFSAGTFMILLGVLAYTAMQKGKISREANLIRDAYKIGTIVPPYSNVEVPDSMYWEYDFVLPGFLMRYDHISVCPNKNCYEYFLQLKKYPAPDPRQYQRILIHTEAVDLYKRINWAK